MAKLYEHLHLDLTPAACECIEAALTEYLEHADALTGSVRQELFNVANEMRSRVQRVAIGQPDISEEVKL